MIIRKLSKEEIEELMAKEIKPGYFGTFGASIPETCTDVIVEGRLGEFLVPASEFEQSGPWGVVISNRAKLAIGGLPKRDEEILAEEMGVTISCAADILYLRTRSRWTSELEEKLIEAHKNREMVNMNSFGVTKETQTKLYWEACQGKK